MTTRDKVSELEAEVEHARATSAISVGQSDRAENVAYREEMEAKLRAARAEVEKGIAREKVAVAIQSAIHDTPNPFTPYTAVADAAIAAHLDALKADGYALVKLADTQIDPEWGDEYWAVPTEDYKYPGKLRIETGYRDGVPRISNVSVPTPMRTTEVDAYVSALLAAKAAAEAQR